MINYISRLDSEILHSFELKDNNEIVEYTILLEDEPIYTGTVIGDSPRVIIDIAPIIRNYGREDITFALDHSNNINRSDYILNIDVRRDNGGLEEDNKHYDCLHFYNPNKDIPLKGILNEYIKGVLDRGQQFYCNYINVNNDADFKITISTESGIIKELTTNKDEHRNIHMYSADLSKLVKPTDKHLVVECGDYKRVYNLAGFNCRDTYVLHYRNLNGAIDSMLLEGKIVESFNNTDTVVKLANNYYNRKRSSHLIADRFAAKTYQLNSGILSDAQSKLMYHLLLSTEMWLEDLRTGSLTSVFITNSNHTIKTFKNDKYVNYELSLEESNKYIIQ